MFCESQFASTTVATEPGDRIVVYTDGLIESRNMRDDLYGEERLHTLLTQKTISRRTDHQGLPE